MMKHIVYNIESGEILSLPTKYARMWKDAVYTTQGPATRAKNKAGDEYAVTDSETYYKEFSPNHDSNGDVLMVERINLMSGKPYMEAIDTPNYCSPASETYWSM
jgi:hypothetical protein|tara:strand:+ start:2014 stop:2325 length:312 start_codon:yes stop_codon:yes gene_type:complete